MYTRRDLGRIALAAIPATALFAKPNSKVNGVQIGAQSYSFRDRPVDEALKAIVEVGLSAVELWQGHVEPKRGTPPEEVKKWRTSASSLEELKAIKKKFDDAGVKIYAFNYSFRNNMTDEEFDYGMQFAKALGTKYITASSQVDMAKRMDQFAKKHGVFVAVHNHDNTKNRNEFSDTETFTRAMDGTTNIKVNLDIGHFTAANDDPIKFIEAHHKDIVTLHIKDRKKDHGANLPFGEGDTPIKEVLQLLKTKKYNIPANIEYEYKGTDAIAEVKKCYEYCRQALA